jgi:serine/threonine-protein kinase
VLTFNARRSSLVKALLAAGLAVVLLAVLGWYIAHRPPAKRVEGAGVDPHNIAVLYLEDRSARHELRYLADGLTEDLITALRSVPRLSVISKAGVREYRGRAVDKDSIARALRVGTIVTGSVEPENDSIRATIRLFDDAGVEIERATFKKSGKDLIALSDSLAQEAGVLIRKWIGTEVQLSRTRAGTQNTGSWAMYQHALLARYRGDSLYEVGDAAGFSRAYSVADSLAAVAERLDPQWPDPIVLRGILEYWRSRRAFDDPGLAKMAIDDGLGHAERALALDQKNFDALELRGNLKYYRWLFPLEPDSAKRDLLIASARTDLERAKQLNPNQASAYAMLSHLYANLPDKTLVDVILAASQALDKDAYLSNADVIMLRLSLASYDLGHFPDADRWCREGQRRFPKDYRFVECELLIMTSKFADADRRTAPERAWKLADSVVRLTSDERERRFQQLNVRVLVAGVLARAGLIDSARRVLRTTRHDPELDPSRDLANTAAFVWTLAGDTTEAINNIKAYLVANPSRRADFRDNPNWWFRGLMNDPRYREVVGMAR